MDYNDLYFELDMILKGYTVEEAAKELGVHWQTVLNCIKRGELEAVKMGRGYRIAPEALKAFIERRTTGQKGRK